MIRDCVKANFKNLNKNEIENSIEESIKTNEEIILPGLGVFFEILWNNSDKDYKDYILSTIKKNI